MRECQYPNVDHKCSRVAAVRVWSDVNQAWVYGCRAIAHAFDRQPTLIIEATR